ncbi:MAG: 23S rRNA (adenine(2030)-N(6))-methyltransferase RlmJ [Pseudomonadota bacterium]
MNYRHAFHAGNFADVLKHLVLVQILLHLKRKDAPFRVIDTHAGTGVYDLGSEAAIKTGEWCDGVGRVLVADQHSGDCFAVGDVSEDVGVLLRPYAEAVNCALRLVGRTDVAGDAGATGAAAVSPLLSRYPGSPLIAAALMRAQDRLIANELHPDDRAALAATLRQASGPEAGQTKKTGLKETRFKETQLKVMGLDGYTALKSLLPPAERRGVVLVDPPFEQPGEFDSMVLGLSEGLKRFATGIFAMWYPIKALQPVAEFQNKIADLVSAPGKYRCDVLFADLHLRAPRDPDRLNGCGLAIANPPFQLEDRLDAGLPGLVDLLSDDPGRYTEVTMVHA